ncbi:MAG TPA: DegT/DnrJ/EryC1/StrS family aminotransferase [Cytophagaceae bacterium]|nr:DegT/DnrJ/EryC1/StrS family aminotransferase [Cytophagaceae bacterium]
MSYQHEQVKDEIQKALLDVFHSEWYVLGERVERFENEYARYIGVKHCIGVGNGLDALKISLRSLEIGIGDEVIVPANTYIATVLAISEVGATPVLIEPDAKTCNIDLIKIEKKITAKTKAIIPVHLYGLPCEMEALMEIAQRHRLYVIEDNAQAAGAECKGKKTGSFGHLNAHSFYPTKNLGCFGDGGAITTDDDELAVKVRMLRNYGSKVKYHNEVLGYNSRLDEIQAAVLSVKLKYLDRWNQERKQIAAWYKEYLQDRKDITLPVYADAKDKTHTYHLYVVQTPNRDELSTYLKANGIGSLIHYPIPPYRQKAYVHSFEQQHYPLTDKLSSQILSLPMSPGMDREQVKQVANLIHSFKG